jgi:hypothetical protein
VGRRNRQREKLSAPSSEYTDPVAGTLVLRGALTPATRREYQAVRTGGLNQEDAWQRAVEFLFERLAVSWELSGVETRKQRELLARLRVASPDERRFVRSALRTHLAEHFPDLEAP